VAAPLLAGIFTAFERWLMRRLLHHYRRAGRMTYPTVIVGSTEGIEHTMKLLAGSPGLGYAPIAVCPVKLNSVGEPYSDWDNLSPSQYVDAKRQRVLRVLKFNSHLPQTARYLGAQVVLVADVLQRDSKPFNAFSLAVESSGIEMAVAATVADFGGHMLRLRDAATPMPVLTARLPQYSKLMRAVKRFIDIVLSAAAIIVAAIPMVVVAILIKHEDGGPVFYTQDRIGLRGQPFRMMKFRSMRVDAEKYEAEMARDQSGENAVLFKLKKDPRVTKIGTFIRKYSIDEVPQFFNVFLGSMSLVGPRPALPYQVKNYESMYSTRLLAKPGLTGPWQVSGRADLTPEQSERVDVDYIENWSLTTDIAILLKTIVVVLRGTGSY
jgi:exopolysaccharide biosynthesis polyprenyl glycosylphosphotransferase